MHYRVALALFVPIIVGSFVSFTSADSYSIENLNDESTKVGNLREENAVEEERGGGAFKNLLQKAVPTWMRSTTRENAVAQNVVRTSSRKSTQAVTGAAKTAGKHRSMPKKALIGVYFSILAILVTIGLYFTIKSASP